MNKTIAITFAVLAIAAMSMIVPLQYSHAAKPGINPCVLVVIIHNQLSSKNDKLQTLADNPGKIQGATLASINAKILSLNDRLGEVDPNEAEDPLALESELLQLIDTAQTIQSLADSFPINGNADVRIQTALLVTNAQTIIDTANEIRFPPDPI